MPVIHAGGAACTQLRNRLKRPRQLADLGARIHMHSFMPLPGSPFRNEPPAKIDLETQHALLRMSAEGRGYGQWEQQLRIGGERAEMRARLQDDEGQP